MATPGCSTRRIRFPTGSCARRRPRERRRWLPLPVPARRRSAIAATQGSGPRWTYRGCAPRTRVASCFRPSCARSTSRDLVAISPRCASTMARGQERAPAPSARAPIRLGRDIAFAPGEFQPHSIAGRRLIAHELVHTMQQGAAGDRLPPSAGAVSLVQRQPEDTGVPVDTGSPELVDTGELGQGPDIGVEEPGEEIRLCGPDIEEALAAAAERTGQHFAGLGEEQRKEFLSRPGSYRCRRDDGLGHSRSAVSGHWLDP